jgi:hypothetical protein
MTALKKYQRLEATALWRPSPDAQRREVIVSIGDATLVISDLNDTALTHWSLAAIDRQNPGTRPAIYSPDGDPGETLELADDEDGMIRAIETLRGAIARSRPRPGRLRLWSVLAVSAAVAAITLLWLPGAMMRHTVAVVPDIKRTEIGLALLDRIERVAGPICLTPDARPVLARLAARLDVQRIAVLPAGVRTSLRLPGGLILINRALIEDHEEPEVAAGYILAARVRGELHDPLARMLEGSGPFASLTLLTSGSLAPETLDAYAETLLKEERPDPPEEALLEAFRAAGLRSTPYAYARDITGETVLGLIEGDPMTGRSAAPVLPDRDWVLLQSVCE